MGENDANKYSGDKGNSQKNVVKRILKYANSHLEPNLTTDDIERAHRLNRHNIGMKKKW
jgi:hypothetical protein